MHVSGGGVRVSPLIGNIMGGAFAPLALPFRRLCGLQLAILIFTDWDNIRNKRRVFKVRNHAVGVIVFPYT